MSRQAKVRHIQLNVLMQETLCARSATFGVGEGTGSVVECKVAEEECCRGVRYGTEHRLPPQACFS